MADPTPPKTPTEPPAAPAVSLWRQRNFMLLWSGQAVSEMGSAVTQLALPLAAVVALHATTFQVGLLTAATTVAFALIALPAGAIVDRHAKRPIMIGCDVARLAIIGSVPVAALAHLLSLAQLYAVAITSGVCTVFFAVSYQSYLPELVRRSQLMDSNGKLGTTQAFAQVSGPGIAGALVSLVGAARAMGIDALSYAVSVVTLFVIRAPARIAPAASQRVRHRLRAEIAEGLSYVLRHPILRRVMACTGTSNMFTGMRMAVQLIFLIRVLQVQPALVGLTLAAASVGGVVGGAATGRLTAKIGSARIIWVSYLVFGLPMLLAPFAEPGWRVALFLLGMFAGSFQGVVYTVAQLSFRQAICPPQLLGRVNAAVRWIVWGTIPLGALLGSVLGAAIGVRTTLGIAFAGDWAAGFFVYFSPLRHMRDTVELKELTMKSRTVVQLIEQAASRRPHAPAIVFAGEMLTYSQLDDRAEWLAASLSEMGVGAGDFIPLVMRNGPELPVAMIAAMKLAAPFVPIDADGPAELRASMIGALDPKVVLCSPGAAAQPAGLPAAQPAGQPAGPRALTVDVTVAAAHRWCRLPQATLDSLAYGFYTTGSTGAPKCALNIQRGLLNRFLYMSRRFGDAPDEIVMQNSRHVFDSSLWQLLWPLTTGSRVVIPDRAGILDLDATVETIRRHRVTMTDFVPSVFNTLVLMMEARPSLAAHMASLRRVLIGGEEANAAAVHAFRRALPGVAVVNTYGPTECAIGSVFHEITDDDRETIPIGRPIDNTYVVIVNDAMKPVATGEVGEILLGGDCLGAGYLGDQERTRAAFVDNPFGDIPGPRLYRTGDLGRRDDDGLLHFSGRLDQQVKIGGIRVELPEIEVVLLRHPLVHEAKVIAREERGGKWLAGFVTGDDRLDSGELRAYLAGNLAPGLVPKQVVVLPRMPLNLNGKADRNALARLAARLGQPAGKPMPLGDTERAVWQIWRELLPVPPSAGSEDFFELGGDSLTAHRLAIALTGAFGVAISARDIVEAPTVEQQAGLVDGTAGTGKQAVRTRTRFDEDARLPASITPPDRPAAARCGDILLSGATGFIGAQFLHDLLTRTAADIYCLVRAGDPASAQRRVLANLAHYRLLPDELTGRIHAVCGDLARPRLGLDPGVYSQLAHTVDTVVHTGALVNLARGYAAHRSANVIGTAGILAFATASRLKHVHHTSTLSAVPGDCRIPAAEDPVSSSGRPEGGYSQSKWIAERLLQQAAERGVPVTVYRLGEVMPHSVSGVPSPRGLADLLVKACLGTGLCFTSSIVTDCTPVDWVSRVVIAAIGRGESGYFHVRHPRPVAFDELLGALYQEFGLPAVSYPEFWRTLRAVASARPGDADLARALILLPSADTKSTAELAVEMTRLFSDGASRSDATNTDRLMADTGMCWPELDRGVFERYAAYHRCYRPARSLMPTPVHQN